MSLSVSSEKYGSSSIYLYRSSDNVGGIALAVWGGREFRNFGTGYRLNGGSSILVTSGPFKISRNPIYLGMLLWLIGMAVLLGSLTPFIFPVLFFILTNFIMIPFEERI